MYHIGKATRGPIWPDLTLGLALAAAISLGLWPHHQALEALGAALLAHLVLSALVLAGWRGELPNFGWANRVTLLRGAMITALAGMALAPLFRQASLGETLWPLSLLALIALLLDGVDGWIARRTRSLTRFGARFDMELDALLMLLLCIALITHDKAGAWVLALGGMRYTFLVAGKRWTWLQAPLPDSLRRKTICVVQVGALILSCTPFTPATLATPLLAIALILLSGSFLRDIHWLYRQAR
ncbi:CDP-alcohol phosphatidyltransferase family protein [Halomonas halmophila]|uniref:CDP-alcohol phosphatidyltransferase n=1 Tax=Halomonas halmophila TaxID=252 RepID=A0A4Y4F7E7_9GAMM|nr:CDP-alcohol phosphatidyltransferase family protein [Halomonas halmophila]GED23754.1 hypothetical protein HHA01_27310 [Halomonas halmophila]